MASVWTGHLTLGLISMPVQLFSGARSSGISFNMLHRTDKSRLKQQYICQTEGVVVGRDDMVKGYEFRKDEYLVIEPSEIKSIEPPSGKVMEVLEFVDAGSIDPVYFESSYYMKPEEAGKHAYDLLVVGMLTSNRFAIAKVAMHNREYTTFIRPYEGGLMLHTMYYQEEVKRVDGFGTQNFDTLRDSVKPEEVNLVHQLIDALTDIWDPSKYKDSFQENLKKLIETKLEGGEMAPRDNPKTYPVVDIMAAIKQSLAQMEKKEKKKK